MAQGLYIVSAEPRSGKSLVVLGVMDLLVGQGKKVGFFRPVIRSGRGRDGAIHLIATHYNLPFAYETMYGCTNDTAREFVASGRHGEFISQILAKYHALAEQCDFVVCSGTDFTGVVSAIELEINLELANNLGCLVMPVVKGLERSPSEVVTAALAFEEALKEDRCEVVAKFVNRVAADRVENLREELRNALPVGAPLYVVPEQPLLGRPTIGEVVTALGADCLSCEKEGLEREVADYKVAAMELPNFLMHLGDRDLVITPGDRSDIVLGSLLADASESFPQVAGLLLTGNLKPSPAVQQLIDGLSRSPVPVLSVPSDTFETATAVSAVEGRLIPENKRKIAAALGGVEAGVDLDELQERISVTRSARVTPLMFEYELARRAKADRRHIVLPEGTDERILRAAEVLRLRDVVDLTLLGNKDKVQQKVSAAGLTLQGVPIVDPATSELRDNYARAYYDLRKHKGISEQMARDVLEDVSYFGTMMVHFGDADGMVSGAAHTTQHTIRPSFEIIKTKPGCAIVSSVFLMCMADRVLAYGDCAVNPNPSAEQLADIAVSSAATARMFGIDPFVAMLSYSTGESGKGEDVERVREATRLARQMKPDLKIEGPIQYDAAVDAGVAASKLPGSEVAGHATVFIFPDLNTGNNTYKAVQRSAGAVAIGPVLQGLNKPVNDLSRGCLVADIVNTVAITAIQAQQA